MGTLMLAGHHELVATGNILSINPDRIIAKRIVLSGHPFRITKKMATVRYMFFNRGTRQQLARSIAPILPKIKFQIFQML